MVPSNDSIAGSRMYSTSFSTRCLLNDADFSVGRLKTNTISPVTRLFAIATVQPSVNGGDSHRYNEKTADCVKCKACQHEETIPAERSKQSDSVIND
jgi:hypothetical protein